MLFIETVSVVIIINTSIQHLTKCTVFDVIAEVLIVLTAFKRFH